MEEDTITYVPVRSPEAIEDLIERSCETFESDDDEAYAQGIWHAIEWLFDKEAKDPFDYL